MQLFMFLAELLIFTKMSTIREDNRPPAILKPLWWVLIT